MMPINTEYWNRVTQDLEIEANRHLAVPDTDRAKEYRSAEPVRVIYVYREPSFWDYYPAWAPSYWGRREVHHHHYHSAPAERRERSENEREADRANVALWVGGLAAAVAAFAVGYLYNQYKEASEAYTNAQELRAQTKPYGVLPQSVTCMVGNLCRIQDRVYSKAFQQTAAAVALLASGVVTFAGGMMVAPAVITAGQVGLFATTLFGLVSLGLHWSDEEKNRKDWRIIRDTIPDARAELQLPPSYLYRQQAV